MRHAATPLGRWHLRELVYHRGCLAGVVLGAATYRLPSATVAAVGIGAVIGRFVIWHNQLLTRRLAADRAPPHASDGQVRWRDLAVGRSNQACQPRSGPARCYNFLRQRGLGKTGYQPRQF